MPREKCIKQSIEHAKCQLQSILADIQHAAYKQEELIEKIQISVATRESLKKFRQAIQESYNQQELQEPQELQVLDRIIHKLTPDRHSFVQSLMLEPSPSCGKNDSEGQETLSPPAAAEAAGPSAASVAASSASAATLSAARQNENTRMINTLWNRNSERQEIEDELDLLRDCPEEEKKIRIENLAGHTQKILNEKKIAPVVKSRFVLTLLESLNTTLQGLQAKQEQQDASLITSINGLVKLLSEYGTEKKDLPAYEDDESEALSQEDDIRRDDSETYCTACDGVTFNEWNQCANLISDLEQYEKINFDKSVFDTRALIQQIRLELIENGNFQKSSGYNLLALILSKIEPRSDSPTTSCIKDDTKGGRGGSDMKINYHDDNKETLTPQEEENLRLIMINLFAIIQPLEKGQSRTGLVISPASITVKDRKIVQLELSHSYSEEKKTRIHFDPNYEAPTKSEVRDTGYFDNCNDAHLHVDSEEARREFELKSYSAFLECALLTIVDLIKPGATRENIKTLYQSLRDHHPIPFDGFDKILTKSEKIKPLSKEIAQHYDNRYEYNFNHSGDSHELLYRLLSEELDSLTEGDNNSDKHNMYPRSMHSMQLDCKRAFIRALLKEDIENGINEEGKQEEEDEGESIAANYALFNNLWGQPPHDTTLSDEKKKKIESITIQRMKQFSLNDNIKKINYFISNTFTDHAITTDNESTYRKTPIVLFLSDLTCLLQIELSNGNLKVTPDLKTLIAKIKQLAVQLKNHTSNDDNFFHKNCIKLSNRVEELDNDINALSPEIPYPESLQRLIIYRDQQRINARDIKSPADNLIRSEIKKFINKYFHKDSTDSKDKSINDLTQRILDCFSREDPASIYDQATYYGFSLKTGAFGKGDTIPIDEFTLGCYKRDKSLFPRNKGIIKQLNKLKDDKTPNMADILLLSKNCIDTNYKNIDFLTNKLCEYIKHSPSTIDPSEFLINICTIENSGRSTQLGTISEKLRESILRKTQSETQREYIRERSYTREQSFTPGNCTSIFSNRQNTSESMRKLDPLTILEAELLNAEYKVKTVLLNQTGLEPRSQRGRQHSDKSADRSSSQDDGSGTGELSGSDPLHDGDPIGSQQERNSISTLQSSTSSLVSQGSDDINDPQRKPSSLTRPQTFIIGFALTAIAAVSILTGVGSIAFAPGMIVVAVSTACFLAGIAISRSNRRARAAAPAPAPAPEETVEPAPAAVQAEAEVGAGAAAPVAAEVGAGAVAAAAAAAAAQAAEKATAVETALKATKPNFDEAKSVVDKINENPALYLSKVEKIFQRSNEESEYERSYWIAKDSEGNLALFQGMAGSTNSEKPSSVSLGKYKKLGNGNSATVRKVFKIADQKLGQQGWKLRDNAEVEEYAYRSIKPPKKQAGIGPNESEQTADLEIKKEKIQQLVSDNILPDSYHIPESGALFEPFHGITLDKAIKKKSINPTQVSLGLLEEVVKLHEKGYFHRDIKPANICVKNDRVKLIDFQDSMKISDCNTLANRKKIVGTTNYYSIPIINDSDYSQEFSSEKFCTRHDLYSTILVLSNILGEEPTKNILVKAWNTLMYDNAEIHGKLSLHTNNFKAAKDVYVEFADLISCHYNNENNLMKDICKAISNAIKVTCAPQNSTAGSGAEVAAATQTDAAAGADAEAGAPVCLDERVNQEKEEQEKEAEQTSARAKGKAEAGAEAGAEAEQPIQEINDLIRTYNWGTSHKSGSEEKTDKDIADSILELIKSGDSYNRLIHFTRTSEQLSGQGEAVAITHLRSFLSENRDGEFKAIEAKFNSIINKTPSQSTTHTTGPSSFWSLPDISGRIKLKTSASNSAYTNKVRATST